MAIGVAMLGFGASGTLLALAGPIAVETAERWFVRAAVGAALALLAAPALADAIPLDAGQLPWDPSQWARLAGLYTVLAIPFATGALVVLLGITLAAERPGGVYGASFLGSGMGAALGVAVLWVLPPERALAAPALVASLGAVTAVSRARAPRAWLAAGAALAVAGAAIARPPWALDVSPYKALPQTEAYPAAVRTAEHTSPLGWLVAVQAPAFRYAPGLSLAYRGPFPPQTGLFVDGALAGAVTQWEGREERAALLHWLPAALPYALGAPERVLVIGVGGGMGVWSALAHGARQVTAVEVHPHLAELARGGDPPTAWEAGTRVRWVTADARNFVAHTEERYDLVVIGAGGAPGGAAAGLHSLNEDFLHTVEAYRAYLDRLRPGGLFAVTRWLEVPPRSGVRTVLTATAALEAASPGTAGRGLFVARSWGTATVLARPHGFTTPQLDLLRAWAERQQLDVDWHDGLDSARMRFHVLAEPVLFQAARAAAAGRPAVARFAAAYPFDVRPARDARPYPHHFLRLTSLGTVLRTERGAWLPFAEWGYVALVATLVQAAVLAAAFMLLPTLVRAPTALRASLFPLVGYFAALGLAYLAVEIAAIQQLGLLLGHPVYAVAAALVAFLVCSGAGSVWSDRRPPAGVRLTGLALPAVLLAAAAGTLPLVQVAQPAPLAVRALLALAVIAPVAFLMGMPFPAGLRRLAGGERERIAWAWAANGFASVVAAPLAALVALEAGSPALFAAGAAAYAAAGAALRVSSRR